MPGARSGNDQDSAATLGFYRFLNNLKWPRSYLGRLLLVCAAASAVPLVESLLLVVFAPDLVEQARTGVLTALVTGHLVAIGLMLMGLRKALEPLRISVAALDAYQRDRRLPQLPGDFDDEPGRLMREISRTILSAESVHAELLDRAETDPLTEISNRRRFLRLGTDALKAAQRTDAAFSLIIFDIDRFKAVNDTYGHAAGDLVLRLVASVVARDLRARDAFARIGGEEFALALPDTPLSEAVRIAEQLRYRISILPFPMLDGAGITASFGVAAAEPGDGAIERIMHRADLALYDAKRGGRDCVACRAAGGGDRKDRVVPAACPAPAMAAQVVGSDVAWYVD